MPHLGFQLFRQPDRKLLVMSPFRLGGEPNVRVGVAMITSAPDAISLHEDSINEMWSRSLKGQAAADCLRNLLASDEGRGDAESSMSGKVSVLNTGPRAGRPR